MGGIQTMSFHGSDQQSHTYFQQPLARQNSWYGLTLDQVEGNLGKPLGSMNLDELLRNVWPQPTPANDHDHISAVMRAFSGRRTVDEVWRDIKHGQKLKKIHRIMEEKGQDQEREPTLGEITLKDFLVKAGLFVSDTSLGPTMAMGLDHALSAPQAFMRKMGLPSSPSIDALSDGDAPVKERGRKRNVGGDALEKTLERRLRRKIKNRESAARSRARKQAYQNELVSKVSHLEEENMKLKKEKEFDTMFRCVSSYEPRYQLRRTTSF